MDPVLGTGFLITNPYMAVVAGVSLGLFVGAVKSNNRTVHKVAGFAAVIAGFALAVTVFSAKAVVLGTAAFLGIAGLVILGAMYLGYRQGVEMGESMQEALLAGRGA